jgi:hypothetical protein
MGRRRIEPECPGAGVVRPPVRARIGGAQPGGRAADRGGMERAQVMLHVALFVSSVALGVGLALLALL